MAIVYRHRRLDTNEIFYVGIGKDEKRAYNKLRRSKFWKNIIEKTDYQVEIISNNISKEQACELEIFLIQQYGRKDLGLGNLVNLSDGGEIGALGSIRSEESRKMMSINRRGKTKSKEARLNMNKDKIGIPKTDECKMKMSKASLGKPKSNEHRNNISKGIMGRVLSQETKYKMSLAKNKTVIDIITGIEYQSAKIVSDLFGINKSTLICRLNGNLNNNTNFKYKTYE